MSDNSWSFRPPDVAYSMTIPYKMNDTMMPKKEKASHLQYTNPWSGVSCSASPLEPAIAARARARSVGGVSARACAYRGARSARAQRRRRKWRCQAQASRASARVGRALLQQWPRRRVLGFSAPGYCAVANSSIAAMNRCFGCARFHRYPTRWAKQATF